jgi:hypothetical protein
MMLRSRVEFGRVLFVGGILASSSLLAGVLLPLDGLNLLIAAMGIGLAALIGTGKLASP